MGFSMRVLDCDHPETCLQVGVAEIGDEWYARCASICLWEARALRVREDPDLHKEADLGTTAARLSHAASALQSGGEAEVCIDLAAGQLRCDGEVAQIPETLKGDAVPIVQLGTMGNAQSVTLQFVPC
mmetsp:Transcript_104568/g.326096  ORF Transcript_104568/g.326096 Transcript_104568/m.326096 type:complete len:128 (+) Transcript_104568:240-623(+)